MEHLGHSSITVTMNVYGHLFPSDMAALAEGLGETVKSRYPHDTLAPVPTRHSPAG